MVVQTLFLKKKLNNNKKLVGEVKLKFRILGVKVKMEEGFLNLLKKPNYLWVICLMMLIVRNWLRCLMELVLLRLLRYEIVNYFMFLKIWVLCIRLFILMGLFLLMNLVFACLYVGL